MLCRVNKNNIVKLSIRVELIWAAEKETGSAGSAKKKEEEPVSCRVTSKCVMSDCERDILVPAGLK